MQCRQIKMQVDPQLDFVCVYLRLCSGGKEERLFTYNYIFAFWLTLSSAKMFHISFCFRCVKLSPSNYIFRSTTGFLVTFISQSIHHPYFFKWKKDKTPPLHGFLSPSTKNGRNIDKSNNAIVTICSLSCHFIKFQGLKKKKKKIILL